MYIIDVMTLAPHRI